MRMIERVRLIEEIGSADGCRGVEKWVRGWRRLRWLQRAVDTMPALLHVVFDPIRYEELDYHAVAVRLGIDVKEVEHRFSCALHYLQLVGRGEMNVADAQAAVPRTEAELALGRVRWEAMWAAWHRFNGPVPIGRDSKDGPYGDASECGGGDASRRSGSGGIRPD